MANGPWPTWACDQPHCSILLPSGQGEGVHFSLVVSCFHLQSHAHSAGCTGDTIAFCLIILQSAKMQPQPEHHLHSLRGVDSSVVRIPSGDLDQRRTSTGKAGLTLLRVQQTEDTPQSATRLTTRMPNMRPAAGRQSRGRWPTRYTCRRGRYWIASARCGVSMDADPDRSAIVRASLRMRLSAGAPRASSRGAGCSGRRGR